MGLYTDFHVGIFWISDLVLDPIDRHHFTVGIRTRRDKEYQSEELCTVLFLRVYCFGYINAFDHYFCDVLTFIKKDGGKR